MDQAFEGRASRLSAVGDDQLTTEEIDIALKSQKVVPYEAAIANLHKP